MHCITLSLVIRTFAHKGLRRFFEQDDRRGISYRFEGEDAFDVDLEDYH